jgi:hypothetical protein
VSPSALTLASTSGVIFFHIFFVSLSACLWEYEIACSKFWWFSTSLGEIARKAGESLDNLQQGSMLLGYSASLENS